MIPTQTAIRHWVMWCTDNGRWRQTCFSIEARYTRDPERYTHDDDKETAARRLDFRYDNNVGKAVEDLINTMPEQEKLVLRARHVKFPPALTDEQVANRCGMSHRSFDTIMLAATGRFGRLWRETNKAAA